jgi:phage repressor protein C with HTH and peptisase S24 domain
MDTYVFSAEANIGCMKIETDAMSPTFQVGSYVAVTPGDFECDAVYAVKLGGVIQIKRIMWTPQGFRIISDNQAYPNYTVKPKEIVFIGRVSRPFNKPFKKG